MKRISTYLKMRVLGAIDFAEGASIQQRIKTVSQMTFHDEDHVPHQFTGRTIQTWLTRYKKHGLTELKSRRRSDTGKPRKVTPEQLLEAIEQVYTIVECCRRRGLDPYAYLRYVLTRLPFATNWQIGELTPEAWANPTRSLKRAA